MTGRIGGRADADVDLQARVAWAATPARRHSGPSTLWLADRVGEVISIDHNADFAAVVEPALAARDEVTVRLVEPR